VGGSIDSDLTMAAVTWSCAEAERPWSVAVTLAFPTRVPVATPAATTATASWSDVDQVTCAETSWTLPSENVAVAMNGCWTPAGTLAVGGETEIARSVTVTQLAPVQVCVAVEALPA
jgi:hypothetical protein